MQWTDGVQFNRYSQWQLEMSSGQPVDPRMHRRLVSRWNRLPLRNRPLFWDSQDCHRQLEVSAMLP